MVLMKLKLQPSVVSQALIECDDKILSLPNLESLDVITPADDEINTVSSYEGDKSLLGNPEKFIAEIIKVKGFQFRIKALKFKYAYKDYFDDLEPKIKQLDETFESLTKNEWIVKLLELSLAVGNYLNG